MLVIDAGDFFPARTDKRRAIDARYFFRGMKLLKYDVAGLGEGEIQAGLDEVAAAMKECRVPIVSANIIDRSLQKPVALPFVVKDLDGTRRLFGRVGAARVGIFSVALPGFVYRADGAASKRYSVVDPKLSALEAVTKLRSRGCDLVIAISHQGWQQSLALAREVPGIDLVLNGHSSHKRSFSERVGSTTVVDAGEKERSFTEVTVTFSGDSLSIAAADVCEALFASPGDPRFLDLQKDFEREIKEYNRARMTRHAGTKTKE